MPIDALPHEWRDSTERTTVRREYRDALGRPLRGKVTLTGTTGAALNGITVPAAPVVVELVGGVLEAALLPDIYRLTGDLRTAEGAKVTVRDEIALEAS